MLSVLLVGFEYSGQKLLEGISLDLFRVWSFFRQATSDITIMTDIERDPTLDASILFDARYPISGDATTFIDDRKRDGSLISIPKVESCSTFQALLTSWTSKPQVPCMVVYFSGHGVRQGSIRLPDRSLFDARLFRDTALQRLAKNGQLVWMWDACFPVPLDLPYKWCHERQMWKRKGDPCKNLPYRILCLTSSGQDLPSLAGKRGSLWSTVLFAFALQHKHIDHFFKVLVKKMRERVSPRYCHPSIWCSDPLAKFLPFPLTLPVPSFLCSQQH